jgi:hypothetical protein
MVAALSPLPYKSREEQQSLQLSEANGIGAAGQALPKLVALHTGNHITGRMAPR